MFKIVIFLMKWCFLFIAFLILGQLVHWNDQPLSDQVKITLSHPHTRQYLFDPSESIKKAFHHVKTWLKNFSSILAQETLSKPWNSQRPSLKIKVPDPSIQETISEQEKQKLNSILKTL